MDKSLRELAIKYFYEAIVEEKAKVALKFLRYFRITKLAEIIGVERQTIYNWMKKYQPKDCTHLGPVTPEAEEIMKIKEEVKGGEKSC